MPVSLTAARGPGTVCTGAQREPAQVKPFGAQPPQEGSEPRSPSQNQTQFTCPLCLREKTCQSTAASVAAHQREVHPGEGNRLLEKLGRPLQKTRRSSRYGVYYKCRDLHMNLSRHSSGCDRVPPSTIPPNSDGLGGEPSARNPVTPSTPAAESPNQSEQSSPSILLPWGKEDVGPMLDALDGTTFARMSLSTAKAVLQEHRMPSARSLRHALRNFCQAHNALQVPTTRPSSLTLRKLPSFSTLTQLFYSRRMDAVAGKDAITRAQEENRRASLTGWWCSPGEVGRKHGKIHPKPAEHEQVS